MPVSRLLSLAERTRTALGLVSADREGRYIRYRLHDHHVADLLTVIRHSREHVELGWSDLPRQPSDRSASPT